MELFIDFEGRYRRHFGPDLTNLLHRLGVRQLLGHDVQEFNLANHDSARAFDASELAIIAALADKI